MGDWRSLARPVALQASFFGALGVGAYVLRHLSKPSLHPLVMEHNDLSTQYPALASSASKLAALDDAEGFRLVVEKLARVVQLDRARAPEAQWQISRLSSEIVADAVRMCGDSMKRTPSEEGLRRVFECQEDVVPQLRGHLDNLLHNHLLARAPVG